jgi:hypothetical protein
MADDNGQQQPIPEPAPPPGELLELQCTQCKEKFFVRTPKVEIINRPICSMLIVPHPETQFCPSCGQGYQYFLQALGAIQSAWTPVQDKSAPRILVPPPGTKIPKLM